MTVTNVQCSPVFNVQCSNIKVFIPAAKKTTKNGNCVGVSGLQSSGMRKELVVVVRGWTHVYRAL